MSLIKTTRTLLVALGLCCLSAAPVLAEFLDDPPAGLSLYMDVPTAYMLQKGQLEVSAFYRTVNDTVDVFNFKADAISGNNIGTRGDYHGLQGIFHFGLWDGLQVSYKGELRELGAGLSTGDVEITSHDVMLKQRLLVEDSWYPTIAFGAFYRGNRAENISRTFNTVGGSLGGISIPSIPLTPPTTITFGGIEDDSFGVTLLASKTFAKRWSIHGLAEYSRTDVDSELGLDLSTNLTVDFLSDLQDILETSNYNSNNFAIGFGGVFQITPKFVVSADYKRIQVSRSGESQKPAKEFNSNNVISWRASYLPTSWLAFSVNGTYFTNQFLGEIHSLYNARTASKFNQDYGYVGFGITVFHDFAAALFPGQRF
jgi:hypothetical protein